MKKRAILAAAVGLAIGGAALTLTPTAASAMPLAKAPISAEQATPQKAYYVVVRRYYYRRHWHRRCWVGPFGGLRCRRWWG
ncbi:hypothetical protein [Methylovirgula sp. 4M-Z18]|uniref:hypothetical protein n=1 Tax=Methylovirgula sp. 4M-Z18 TaxID=2293567 RepID=UPI000E2F2529|nr:hypothetical protein [Methylovirgula sp. 4M-Z18]RFB80828.1 hypothetical protein DYH55_04960 [Methylovirgula sp. 4M-Z18]